MNLEPSTTESNYLHTVLRTTCLCARPHLHMRISSIMKLEDFVSLHTPTLLVGASLSEPHTSESNGGFFIYYYILLLYICHTYVCRSVNAD